MTSAAAEFEIPVRLHLIDGLRERVEAHISRVKTGFLVLSSPIALEKGRQMHLIYLDRPIHCEIANCALRGAGKYRIAAHMLEESEGISRAERRITLDAPAHLNTSGLRTLLPVRIIDMSSSGLGVKLQRELKVDELAYVEMEHGVAFGEIRHCRKIEGGFRAGLFVEEFISRTPGAPNPWARHSEAADGQTKTFSLAQALETA